MKSGTGKASQPIKDVLLKELSLEFSPVRKLIATHNINIQHYFHLWSIYIPTRCSHFLRFPKWEDYINFLAFLDHAWAEHFPLILKTILRCEDVDIESQMLAGTLRIARSQ